MKAASSLLGTIMDLGKEMLIAGAEVWRVEEILRDVFEAYCFRTADLWVLSTCINATVSTWDDRVYTQIRNINGRNYDLDKLDLLYDLAHDICEKPTGVNKVRERLDEITGKPGVPKSMVLLGAAFGTIGFTAYFCGSVADMLTAALAGLLLTLLGRRIRVSVNNLLAYNTVASFLLEAVALTAFSLAFAGNIAAITTAGMYMLISGLGLTNGIADLLHGHTLSGLSETSNALLGAGGIAIGITLAMVTYDHMTPWKIDVTAIDVVSDPWLQVIMCTLGCVGFALMFGAKGKTLVFSAIGAAFIVIIDTVLTEQLGMGVFDATFICAMLIIFYASIVSRFVKIPSGILRISCVFPLIPGTNLYFMVFGVVTLNNELFRTQGKQMILIALGIALGYIIADVIIKFIRIAVYKYSGIRL